ncbi:GNAT family N-acetyltransferase [Acetanaerobacterium elongatum]|uniref:N-acetylglutamate synthase, GNAT family n=1 Tax=Acetanaerobacterium elongatum TaxID=258515 RepID=A0A1H0AJJ1_9FIRM|nr:GNAT family N-acetyltransferase [Acetanaerobacterium elongatum]SDN33531.1 N-acetylglutamate synthase, GNAT family [Acetanaerobacterium elongatum]
MTVKEHSPKVSLRYITDGEQIPEVKEIFLEYARSLNFNLCFQSFEKELQELLKRYAPPEGALILADADGKTAGCVAMHRLDGDICEMKRLYVRETYRNAGLGKRLVKAVIASAKNAGYKYIRLDTLSSMKAAQRLYLSLGFYDIEPYVYNPLEGARYMEYKIDD